MITLKTYGGLANRMRVIDSTYQASIKSGHKLKVIWEMSDELNCSFFKLFQPVNLFDLSEYYIGSLPKKMKGLINKTAHKANINLPLGFNHYISDELIDKARNENTIMELFPKAGSIFISTVHQYLSANDSFSFFKPATELQATIDTIKASYAQNTVGIHIRRTDNAMSIEKSPRELFIEKMQAEIDKHADTRFFLATDSAEEEAFLCKEFPGKIITYEKVLSRASEKGIQDALIDLYCLANTNKILGSFYSSFSEVAAQIHNIPIEMVIRD